MPDEIVNRVANSQLVTIDLEDWYPKGERITFDIAQWLYESLILKEKEFRKFVDDYNWSRHEGHYVALTCSADAIVPSWAYLLVSTRLSPYASKVVVGTPDLLETLIYQDIIAALDVKVYGDKPVIIKGCADKPIPATAYIALIEKLQPVVKSLMYGEACSSVPLYKSKK